MKIEHIDEAVNAVKEYRRLKAQIENFTPMKWFNVHGGSDAATSIDLSGSVNIDQSGSNGSLATAIRSAVSQYYNTHLRIAEERLDKLGIER